MYERALLTGGGHVWMHIWTSTHAHVTMNYVFHKNTIRECVGYITLYKFETIERACINNIYHPNPWYTKSRSSSSKADQSLEPKARL